MPHGLALSIDLVAGQSPAAARHWTLQRFSEPLGGLGVALGLRFFVEPIVRRAVFSDRLDETEVGFGTASRATEWLGAIVDIMQSGELQPRVAPADMTAHPHLPVGLGENAEGVGAGQSPAIARG